MISNLHRTQSLAFCTLIALMLWIAASHSQSLPKEQRADQYLLQAQEAYREGNYRQAVEAFSRIESLGVSMPSEFHFFYGSSLAETGDYASALMQLSRYLDQEGRDGRQYQNALRLYGEIEQEREERARQQQFAPVRSQLVQFLNSTNSDFRASEVRDDADDLHYLNIISTLKAMNPEECKIELDSNVHYMNYWEGPDGKNMAKMKEEKIEINDIIDMSMLTDIDVENRSSIFGYMGLPYNYLRLRFRSDGKFMLTRKEYTWVKEFHGADTYRDQDETPVLDIPLKEKLPDERISSLKQAFHAWVAYCNENV